MKHRNLIKIIFILAISTLLITTIYPNNIQTALTSKGTSNLEINWEKTFGGVHPETAFSVLQTNDGGFLLVGNTEESFLTTKSDMWVVKTDEDGNMMWNETYGGFEQDFGYCVIQSSNGGYAIAGVTFGTLSLDVWLIKINTTGGIEWRRNFDNKNREDMAYSLIETNENGFLLVGRTYINGKGREIFVIKTDSEGIHQWNRTYGGKQDDEGKSVIQTAENDFVITGYTTVRKDPQKDYSNTDSILIRISNTGDLVWNATFGGSGNDDAMCVVQTKDNGFLTSGSRGSLPVTSLSLYRDIWFVKTDNDGVMEWNKTYGYTNSTDMSYSVIQTPDKGYIAVGFTQPKESLTDRDIMVIKTDVNGSMEWNKTYGGQGRDIAYSVIKTTDESYVLTGVLDIGTNQNMFLKKFSIQSQETSDSSETDSPETDSPVISIENVTPGLSVIQVITMIIVIGYLKKKR